MGWQKEVIGWERGGVSIHGKGFRSGNGGSGWVKGDSRLSGSSPGNSGSE